jgi:AcrR family transcriptional regulator
MGYEVVKTIGTGKYRYEVESYRDPQTGKVRNKWRYLGKAEGDRAPRRRTRGEETREKLTAALERLVEDREWQQITAQDIAAEAGVAPATLYRYFRSRDDVLLACAARANEALDDRLAKLQQTADTLSAERTRFKAWASSILEDRSSSAVLLALLSSGLSSGERRRERQEHRRRAFAFYLERLAQIGYIPLRDDLAETAVALALIVQAFTYRALLGQTPLQSHESTALTRVIERLIFVQ